MMGLNLGSSVIRTPVLVKNITCSKFSNPNANFCQEKNGAKRHPELGSGSHIRFQYPLKNFETLKQLQSHKGKHLHFFVDKGG